MVGYLFQIDALDHHLIILYSVSNLLQISNYQHNGSEFHPNPKPMFSSSYSFSFFSSLLSSTSFRTLKEFHKVHIIL